MTSGTDSPADGLRPKPRHIAVIMDGNGRWAEARGLPRTEGHRRGLEAARRVVEAAIDAGVPYLTLFSFSSENWSRPPAEVSFLMSLLKRFIRRDLADLHRNGVRIRVIGEREGVDPDIVKLLDDAEVLTAGNTALDLMLAFNYGSRAEIARGCRRIAERVGRGELAPGDVTAEVVSAHLDTAGIPDPDLLIRTSGEIRLSNFLLWQLAYAEFVFLDVFWPDFTAEHLIDAIAAYQRRSRRFGGLAMSTG
ncbi:MAG: isoprenyl transferase [Hyphomicrobiaceae bacterium]